MGRLEVFEMNIQIDNYYISTNSGGYMKICIDGQNIIHTRTKCETRNEAIIFAVNEIEKYNERHNLEWGEYDI